MKRFRLKSPKPTLEFSPTPKNTTPHQRHIHVMSKISIFIKSFLVLVVGLILSTPLYALSESQLDRFAENNILFYDPEGGDCVSGISSGSSSIPYSLPAESGGYGHEEEILADGSIPSGGKISFWGLAKRLSQEYRDYAINMRWNYVSWYWGGGSSSQNGDGSSSWFSESPRIILVTNPDTGKSIYAAALESGPAPWTGYSYLGGIDYRPSWWNQPQYGTPAEYQGRVSGLTPKAYQYLEDGKGDGQRNVRADGTVVGPSLIYQWAEDQGVMPGPTDQVASGSANCILGDAASAYTDDNQQIFLQGDPRWGNIEYSEKNQRCYDENGNIATIKSSGCGPSSLAMVITALTGTTVTPDVIAKKATEKGYRACGVGSKDDIVKIAREDYGLTVTPIKLTDIEAVNQALMSGAIIHTSGSGPPPFSSGGHVIAIRGVTANGKWKIFDSNWNGVENSTKEWDPSEIAANSRRYNGSPRDSYAISK